jgi:chromosome segregation ATPase
MEDKTFALLEKMYSEFISFKEEMLGFKEETINNFKNIDARLQGVETTLDVVETRLHKAEAKLDGEISNRINALLDGYKSNSEKLDEINDKADHLQFDVNNLSIKVANNDNRIIEINRNLRSVK